MEQRRRKKANDGLRLDDAVGKFSVDQEICKSNMIVHNLWKIWRLAPSGTRSYGRQAGSQADEIWVRYEIQKLAVDENI